MKELFKKQFEIALPLTEDMLNKLEIKTYFNGDEKQIGDVVLFAMLMEESHMTVITLNERHFDLFEDSKIPHFSEIPIIKIKN